MRAIRCKECGRYLNLDSEIYACPKCGVYLCPNCKCSRHGLSEKST